VFILYTSTQPQHPARAEKKKKKRSTSAKSPRTETQQRQLLFDSTIIIFARGERVLVA
jgi:hypothetical protein